MKTKTLLIATGCLVALTVGAGFWVILNAQPSSEVTQQAQTCFKNNITNIDLLALTNQERANHGLPALVESATLDAVATLKAQDEIIYHYWGHNSPTGITPWHWYGVAGYNYTYAGENIAEGYETSLATMQAWIASPEHEANIVNAHYTQVGFATVCGTTDSTTTLTVGEYAQPQ